MLRLLSLSYHFEEFSLINYRYSKLARLGKLRASLLTCQNV